MISESWILNLAQSQWETQDQKWDHSPKSNPQTLFMSFQKILSHSKHACERFNQYSTPQRQMRYMAGPPDASMDTGSFILLLGRCDARLSLAKDTLRLEVAAAENFSRSTSLSETFTAHTGSLSETFWKQSDGFLYTEELISMLMLEELVKTWWNYQGSKLEKSTSRKDDAREYHL